MKTLAFARGENDKPRPTFRSFFKIGQLDYEFSDIEIIGAISDLLRQGAAELVITRVILPVEEDKTEQPEEVEENKTEQPEEIEDAEFETTEPTEEGSLF